MASSGASSADAAAWADFAAAAGLDVVAPTTSPTSPITPSPGVEDEVAGPPTSGEPEAEAPPSSGGGLDGDSAVPPTLGEPALVESTPGDEDIAPPVMGVPSSSEDEEELLADPAGAPWVGAPQAAVDVADVGVQTEHNVILPAFDLVDVASQTDGKVAFTTFVGDTPQTALAAAIRALSPGSLLRLDGALRQALAQPLVDVAPSLQGGVASAHAPPDLDLLGDTPVEQPSSSGSVVDPGPGPASARIFWEEQNATAVAEQAAVRPLPDDDFDPPATSLEVYLQDQDAAAGTTTTPSSSGLPSSSSKSPGGKAPFRKAPPPALVEPAAKVSKAPPVPFPDRQIAFLADPPKKPPVKRAPVMPEQAPPPAEAAMAGAPAPSSSAASSSGSVVAKGTAATSQTPAPEDTAPAPAASSDDAPGPSAEHLRQQAFIRQEQMARSQAGMRLLHDGATYAQALESRIEREMEEQRRAADAAALAKAKPKGPPAHLKKGRWDRLRLAAVRASADSFDLGGLAFHSSVAQGRKLMPCATTPAPTDDGRAKPRSTRGRTPRDADARWLEGGRQFAPWHYTVEAMLQDAKGVLHIPPPEVKEQLHHIPPGYTAAVWLGTAGTGAWLPGSWAFSSWPLGPNQWPRARLPFRRRARALSSGCPSSEPLGGRGPHAALAGRLADPGTGLGGHPGVLLGLAPRPGAHQAGRSRGAPGDGGGRLRRHCRLVGRPARPCACYSRHQGQAPTLSGPGARPPAPGRGLPGSRRPTPGRGRRL